MLCHRCNQSNPDESRFCNGCGGPLGDVSAPPPAPPQPPAPEPLPPKRYPVRNIAILAVVAILVVASIMVGLTVMEPEEEWEGAEAEVWVHTVTEYGADNVPNEPYVVEVWYSEGIIFHINLSDTLDDWEDAPFKERVDWYSGTTGPDGKDVFYLTCDTEGFYLFMLVAGTERWSLEELWIDEDVEEASIGPLIQEVPEV